MQPHYSPPKFALTIFSKTISLMSNASKWKDNPTLLLQFLHLSVARAILSLHCSNPQCHESWWTGLLLTLFQSTIQWVFMNRTILTWFSFMYNNLQLFFFSYACFLVMWKTRGKGREFKSIQVLGKLWCDDKHFKASLLTYSSSSLNN